jgi:UDP-N-acetylglucosamine 1-carboxyvinyltransferase
MDAFRIQGGHPLHGAVAVSGAKNAALPIMAAGILAEEPVVLEQAPDVVDVTMMSRVLYGLGVHAGRGPDGRLRLETVDGRCTTAPERWVRRMRASFCVLGPLLARRGVAVVSLPGGCRIGDRPVDLHLTGLRALGAELRIDRGYVIARAKRLRGAHIHLAGPHGPTVTGTANVLSAAVLAEGRTTLTGAALEPEIIDLGRFLIAMGARIRGLGTATLEIDGVARLSGCVHRIIPDRIEAATLLFAAAVAGGRITLTGAQPAHLTRVFDALRRLGVDVWAGGERVTVESRKPLAPGEFIASPYPGLPTDVQAQLTAVLTLAHGRSCVRDQVFPQRFAHLSELRRLGASIRRDGGTSIITGVQQLVGAEVRATDLRASAALVLAGLAAQGETTVHHVHHLDRGYEHLERKLTTLGARIQRLHDIRGARPRRATAAHNRTALL